MSLYSGRSPNYWGISEIHFAYEDLTPSKILNYTSNGILAGISKFKSGEAILSLT
jgi:hypothetical protein